MSSHVPSPASSPISGPHDTSAAWSASQDTAFRSSQSSNPDSSALSLESSFQLESGYTAQSGDSQKHPKGKRKRTTSQDKAILEAAYISNPKPDKAARLELVERVSLNEKEVQIWFQNRRQNDRRKSRPLSPQEIAALRYGGGMHVLSSESLSSSPFGNVDRGDGREETRSGETITTPAPAPVPVPTAEPQLRSQSSLESLGNMAELPKQERRDSDTSSSTPPRLSSAGGEVGCEVGSEPQPLSQQSFSGSIGYLANRWNTGHSFSTPSNVSRGGDDVVRLEALPSSNSSTSNSPASGLLSSSTSSSSQFRLSLSLEGKAEIVSSQQSPPRPAQSQPTFDAATLPPVRAHRALQRSQSAVSAITLPPISALTAGLPPRLTRGRSRDVQAWESCCDADTRDELTKLAENESSGSAIAAISLLRSSSQISSTGSALRPNHSKRNAPPGRSDSTKRPKLGRSMSSVARLQSLPAAPTLRAVKALGEIEPEKKASKASLSTILSPTGGDSDKENWSPDEEGIPIARRRPLPSTTVSSKPSGVVSNSRRAGQRILGEQKSGKRQLLGAHHRSNTAPIPRLRGKARESPVRIFQDEDSGIAFDDDDETEQSAEKRRKSTHDEEVERFMRGEVSPSKKGDVDCVAGLLALSQGNWR
ncbi:hypothetical protein BX600DRAFT_191016 [Xylariales sp. PMI_506]|nr:hypothetical protein BX600DRAFT_191016 [Xylariales sp. PMI_506]